MSKAPLNLDERNIQIILKICAVLYIVTLLLLIGAQLHRQFVMNQAINEYQDIANIITFNVIILIGSLLYLGGFTPQKVKIRHILAIYVGFVLIGMVFTIVKYAVLLGEAIDLARIKEYFIIVSVICGLLVLVWSLLAYLGKKRIDKRIDS